VSPKKESILLENCYKEGCFDLQFRRDIKHDRPKSPTYYRWKVQFVITLDKNNVELLKQARKALNCGQIYFAKNEARYSVQDIDDLYNVIVPFFEKYRLSGNKRKDFDLWVKALKIIFRYKRKDLATWKKKDFERLIKIQKSIQKYKEKAKSSKWLSVAESIAKTL